MLIIMYNDVYVCINRQTDRQIIIFALLCIISGNHNKICRGAGKRECCLGCCNSAQVQTMLLWTQSHRKTQSHFVCGETKPRQVCWQSAVKLP